VRISPSVVIFDYGNVLSESQPVRDVAAMAAILDLPVTRFSEVYWQFRIPYDGGTLAPTEYWNTVAQTASRSLSADQISSLVDLDARGWSHPAPAVPEWATQLRAAGLTTAILSNMPASVRDYVVKCSWLPQVDAQTFSCDVGVCKPEAEIYHDCLTKLGVAASQVLFLDDREPNIAAAEALGLHAVLFSDARIAAREIEERFALPVTLSNLF
jgi:putative hydrolase of the HAD superfamily